MKGLFISLFMFLLFVVSTMLSLHIMRTNRPLRLFVTAFFIWTPVYFLAYFATPPDLYIIPDNWLTGPSWLECAYGYVVFILNAHSYVDFYFGFNRGLSMSIMLALLRHGGCGMTATELAAGYRKEGEDTIIRRRFRNLAEMGLLNGDIERGTLRLTRRGRLAAYIGKLLKQAMNLGKGG